MCFFLAKMNYFLIVAFYALIKNSSHCTFRSVTSSFNASLMATFDKITEEECMSKCSMVLECTFMEYIEGTCKTFKYGTEVQELTTASRVFAYSFNEDETSCPTATVSRPQTSTKKPAVKRSIGDICDNKYLLAEWEAVTLTSLEENPDDLRTCLFSPSPTELKSCRMKFLYSQGDDYKGWYYTTHDEDSEEERNIYSANSVRPYACDDYSAESSYAVTNYICFKNDQNDQRRIHYGTNVAVIDIENRPDPPFRLKHAEIERVDEGALFYVQKFEYV